MAIGIPQPGIYPGNPVVGPGLAAPVAPAPISTTSPSQAMLWLLSVAAAIGGNPMEIAHMFMTDPDRTAAVLDAAGVPSPTPAEAETADVLGEALAVGQPIDYATDPTQTPPQPGLSSPNVGVNPLGTPIPTPEPVSSPDVSILPEQQPGVAVPANAPPTTGTPLNKALSGVVMPPSPQVQGIGAPSAPQPGNVSPGSLDAIIRETLNVARPQAANLTLGQALPQGRR